MLIVILLIHSSKQAIHVVRGLYVSDYRRQCTPRGGVTTWRCGLPDAETLTTGVFTYHVIVTVVTDHVILLDGVYMEPLVPDPVHGLAAIA